MKKLPLLLLLAALFAAPAFAQSNQAGLDKVLNLLDKVSASFKSVQTDFEWDQYEKVVDEHDKQSGTMYFKRTGSSVDVAADITAPEHKKLVFKNNVLEVYVFKTRQTTRKEVGKNQQTVESFLAVGFGGSGRDLTKNFEVRYLDAEPVAGKPTYKLELTPKIEEVRHMFPLITLWIDQQTGMSVQQKLDQGEGDYRLARFTHIEINKSLPSGAFDLKAN